MPLEFHHLGRNRYQSDLGLMADSPAGMNLSDRQRDQTAAANPVLSGPCESPRRNAAPAAETPCAYQSQTASGRSERFATGLDLFQPRSHRRELDRQR